MKIYTKTGDDGKTGLQGGKRISKSNIRITAYGSIDEVNSVLGIILSHGVDDDVQEILSEIQNELFFLGSDLSNPDLSDQKNRVSLEMVENLEKNIDKFEDTLPPLTNFILPGGTHLAALTHFARTVTRRAETLLVQLSEIEEINPNCLLYLNRLSDLFFVLSRELNKRENFEDIVWNP